MIKKRKDSFAKSILAIKIGVEIFGSQNSENEIIDLLIESLKLGGLSDTCLSIGRTEILDEIIAEEVLSKEEEKDLREIISIKSESNLIEWADKKNVNKKFLNKIALLMECYGEPKYLEKISEFSKLAKSSVDSLKKTIENINHKNIHVDMTDFPGFNSVSYTHLTLPTNREV